AVAKGRPRRLEPTTSAQQGERNAHPHEISHDPGLCLRASGVALPDLRIRMLLVPRGANSPRRPFRLSRPSRTPFASRSAGLVMAPPEPCQAPPDPCERSPATSPTSPKASSCSGRPSSLSSSGWPCSRPRGPDGYHEHVHSTAASSQLRVVHPE